MDSEATKLSIFDREARTPPSVLDVECHDDAIANNTVGVAGVRGIYTQLVDVPGNYIGTTTIGGDQIQTKGLVE